MISYFDDIPKPPTFCEAQMNFAERVMEMVNDGKVGEIKAVYAAYSSDKYKKILKRALENYSSPNPITPHEFGLMIFKECR